MGGFVKEFLMKKNPSFNNYGEHYNGFNSATVAASSAAAYFAAAATAAPFASRPLLGFGGRVAYCDAGVTPPILTEDYLTSLRTASETVFRHDTLNYMTKEYSIDMKPLFSAFQPRSFAMTTLRSFLLFYLPLVAPKEDDDNDLDEHPVDWIVPFKKSVKQIFRETSVTTTRRVLERFAVYHCSQRVAWKLLKDVPKSCIRKANRGLPFYTYFFCVCRTTFKGHFLGAAASWLVQVGIECFRFVRDISKSNDELENVADDHTERAKVLGKKVYGATVRCGSSLVFASIGAGIGATIFRPAFGQSFEKEMSGGGIPRSSSAPLKDGIPPKELLDDLCSRFVLNVPKEDQQSFERIMFLVEYAHWFYEDNSVENNPSLKSFTLKEFTSLMFNSCDVLKPYVPHIDDIFKDFTSYKVRVPVTGAIILDQTFERCVLVKGWKGTSWSFPRGKKNKDEEDDVCAIREVLEETGFNVSKLINKEEYIEMIFGPQRVRLYIVGGVKDDTTFAPQTKKEISEIAWQRLDELLPANRDVISRSVTGLKLYMVAPFLKSLRLWISSHQPPIAPRADSPARALSVWKAKGSSSGSNLVMTETPSNSNLVSLPVSHSTFSSDKGPGRSFRNFQFNSAPILQAIDAAFS